MSGSCVSLQVDSKSSIPRKRNATQPQDPTEDATTHLEILQSDHRSLASNNATLFPVAVVPTNSQSNVTKKTGSLKKFARSSSKKLKLKAKPDATTDNEVVVLNNGRDTKLPPTDQSSSALATASATGPNPLLNAPHSIRIQNDTTTKDINKISPQNSFRRQLATRRLSVIINNTQQQHQLQQQQHLLEEFTRQNAMKNAPSGSTSAANYRRRMSSFEHTFEKASNLNLYSMENMNSASSTHDLHTSKLNLAGEVLSAVVGSRKCSTTDSILASGIRLSETNNNNIQEKVFSKQPQFTKHLQRWCSFIDVEEFVSTREEYSLYVFSPENR